MKLKIGKYYLVSLEKTFPTIYEGEYIGKYLGKDDSVSHIPYKYGFEFLENVGGHDCNCRGKNKHCWYVRIDDVIKELNNDEVMVELL